MWCICMDFFYSVKRDPFWTQLSFLFEVACFRWQTRQSSNWSIGLWGSTCWAVWLDAGRTDSVQQPVRFIEYETAAGSSPHLQGMVICHCIIYCFGVHRGPILWCWGGSYNWLIIIGILQCASSPWIRKLSWTKWDFSFEKCYIVYVVTQK